MRLRPTERKMVVNLLLNEDWEDEAECATAIITKLDEMRERDRDYYSLVVQSPTSSGIVTKMYGPFGTYKDAEKAYKKGTGQVSENDKVGVFKMTTPLQADLALEQ